MRCSGCGKDIPFGGNVCPYCQRDKSADQRLHLTAFAIAVLGGFIGLAVGGPVAGIVGLLLGALVGGGVAAFLGDSKSKPPKVRAVLQDPSSPGPAPSLAEKLKELDALKQQGLLSEEEYSAKRKKILDTL